MFEEEKNKNSFLSGLITGGILGCIAGLLFAPKSGKRFRKDISDMGSDLLDDANHLIEDAKEKASDLMSDAKSKADDLLKDAKKRVDSVSDGAVELLSQGREKIEDGAHRISNAVKSGVDTYNEDRKSHKKLH